MRPGITIPVSTIKYPLDVIKHAALAMTDACYARLALQDDRILVEMTLKPRCATRPGAADKLAARFMKTLDWERLRSDIAVNNRDLRAHMLRTALREAPNPPPSGNDNSLTKKQEEELQRIIAEVEADIQKESKNHSKDPLGINQTWEERHGRSRTKK